MPSNPHFFVVNSKLVWGLLSNALHLCSCGRTIMAAKQVMAFIRGTDRNIALFLALTFADA